MNHNTVRSLLNRGADVAWLRSLSSGPATSHGTGMVPGVMKKLMVEGVVSRAGRENHYIRWSRGPCFDQFIQWADKIVNKQSLESV